MIFSHKNLINLPVETKSGHKLGRICDYEIEIDTQKIMRYHVKSDRLISHLLAKELIVHSEQVINITPEKMIVEDNAGKVKDIVHDTVAPPVSM